MNCRLTVFATRFVAKGRGKRKRLMPEGVAWQAWNDDPAQERADGRLAGSGSFHWPNPRAAFRRAVVLLRAGQAEAVRIEGIGSQPVAYLRLADVCRSHRCHPGQPRLIPRF